MNVTPLGSIKPRPSVAPLCWGGSLTATPTVGATDGRGFLEQLAAIREAARVQGGGGKKSWSDEETFQRFKTAAELLRKEVERLEKRAAFDPSSARPAAEAALQTMRLAAVVDERYERRKRELAALEDAALDLMAISGNPASAKEKAQAKRALAALKALKELYEGQEEEEVDEPPTVDEGAETEADEVEMEESEE